MKKSLLWLIAPLLVAACTSKTGSDTGAKTDPANYPYQIKHPDYWLIDTGHTNTLLALNSLKSFEKWDTVTAKKYFANSLEFNYDGGKFKGPISAFFKEVSGMTAAMKDIKIDMKDWESVVSKDGKEEWVTLWYTQKWTDLKGKIDSVGLVNDMKIKNGRIITLNEYDMHYKTPGK